MATFLKEMETIIKENEKLKEENKKLKGNNEQEYLYNENIELRIKLNEKNREISEILLNLEELKKDKISRGQRIGSLIEEIHKLNNQRIIQKIQKQEIENQKQEIENKFKHYREVTERTHKNTHEKQKIMQTQLSKYKMGINQQDQLKNWFNENCSNFNYRLGKELYDIIN